jgi:hypothetical protein
MIVLPTGMREKALHWVVSCLYVRFWRLYKGKEQVQVNHYCIGDNGILALMISHDMYTALITQRYVQAAESTWNVDPYFETCTRTDLST